MHVEYKNWHDDQNTEVELSIYESADGLHSVELKYDDMKIYTPDVTQAVAERLLLNMTKITPKMFLDIIESENEND